MRTFAISVLFAACAALAAAQSDQPAPTAQSVAWHSPQGDVLLRPQLLFPSQDPNYVAYFADVRRNVYAPVSAVGRPHITETTPSFSVQGFGYGADWELVKLERHHGRDALFLPSRDPWGRSWFSDQPFAARDLREVVQSSGGDVYTLRPAAALDAGAYLLCGKPAGDEGGWARFCFDFEIGQ
jgi:hypothetical protein